MEKIFDHIDYTEIMMKTVKECYAGQNKNGYDIFCIVFTDGSEIEVLEQSQTGAFSVTVDLRKKI